MDTCWATYQQFIIANRCTGRHVFAIFHYMQASDYQEQVKKLQENYESSKKSTTQLKEDFEHNLKEAEQAEERAKDELGKFVKDNFMSQLNELIGDAPVVMDVMIPLNCNTLPPYDQPDKYFVRILPALFQDDVYSDGEYASVNTIDMDFIDVRHGCQPWIQPYDCYYPSLCNIPFMPPNTRWHKHRYIPVRTFSVIRDIMERNHNLFMETLAKEVEKLKNLCAKYTTYKAEGECFNYIHLIGKDDVKLIDWQDEEEGLDAWPRLMDWDKSDPFGTPGLTESFNRRKISHSGACKMLDKIVSNNRKYYQETLKKTRKWFQDCEKLKRETNRGFKCQPTRNSTLKSSSKAK